MARIAIITCVNKKLGHKAKAKELYISPLFKYSLAYAKTFKPDKIFILSAKHYLLDLDNEIEPYNKRLNDMPIDEIRAWSKIVLGELQSRTDIDNDEYIFLAGEKYMRSILPYIKNYKTPLKGLSFGNRLHLMKSKLGRTI